MAAFIIANINVKNSEKFQEYAEQAGATFAEYGGELVFRGKHVKSLVGNKECQAVAVVKFGSEEHVDAWFNSDAYQACVNIRNEAAEMTIDSYLIS